MDAPPLTLATVATEDFVPGAIVMFASFLRAHPAFAGDLVTIHDGLSRDAATALNALSPRMRLVRAGADLRDRVAQLADARPDMARTAGRFLSLEALRLGGAQKVLFCDSDTLFLGPLTPLLHSERDVAAVGDGCLLRGHARDRQTMAEVAPGPGHIGGTFNAGVMAFGERARTGADFNAAMALLSAERFGTFQCGLHDQAILNLVFAHRAELFDWRYNYLLKHHGLVQGAARIAPRDIHVLHFNDGAKPWKYGAQQIDAFPDPFQKWAALQWHAASRRVPGL